MTPGRNDAGGLHTLAKATVLGFVASHIMTNFEFLLGAGALRRDDLEVASPMPDTRADPPLPVPPE